MKKTNYNKGLEFAKRVCELFNLYFDLTGRNRVIPTPRSGAINGLKGDLMRLPRPINNWCIECKNEAKVSGQLLDWWAQTVDAAERMAKDPVLVVNIPEIDEILLIQPLKNAIIERLKGCTP